jgi:hypothetical protein
VPCVIYYSRKVRLVVLRISYGNLSYLIGRITFKIFSSVRCKIDVEDITGVGGGSSVELVLFRGLSERSKVKLEKIKNNI